ncbi:MAG: hypothetical protein QOD75_495 [Blastocatellia bacterium]|jgi:hypothetical protein|nr:hypothetical protein [Blastocatellia bacterium]
MNTPAALEMAATDDRQLAGARHAVPLTFRTAWLYWLPPALLALGLALVFLNPFIGDWDGLDYTVLSVRGYPSSMALGRSLFIFFNHTLYRIAHAFFGVPTADAYLIFKWAIVIQCPLAVVACWTLARDLTGSVRAATVTGVLIAVSPVFVLYSGQVMTDVPSVLLLAVALTIYLRGARQRKMWLLFAGAAVLGAGVNVRETTAFYAPWLLIAPLVYGWKFNRRDITLASLAVLIFLIVALSGFAFWYLSDPTYRLSWHQWLASMHEEAALHPVRPRNIVPFVAYFFLTAPLVFVALPVAAWKEWRARAWSPLLACAAVGILSNLLLFFNYSTAVNWRYFLTGLPALAPLAGAYFVRAETDRTGSSRWGFTYAVVGPLVITGVMLILVQPASSDHFNKLALSRDYYEQLKLLPRDAVVMAGSQTVAVTYWRGIGAGDWDVIGIGGGWPGSQLDSVITNHLRQGHRVFLDADRRWWHPCGWRATELPVLVSLQSRFHFQRVSNTIYEIKDSGDATARDQPQLEGLLPDNRPAEVKKCFTVSKGN